MYTYYYVQICSFLGDERMSKKLKNALLLVVILVFALQGAGMGVANAAVSATKWSLDDLTYNNVLSYVDEISPYGVIAHEYYQKDHSEANVFADDVIRNKSNTPFLASTSTQQIMKDFTVEATVTLPEIHLADEMTFGLYTKNGEKLEYTGINTTVDVKNKTSVDLNFGRITNTELMKTELYVRQIENDQYVDQSETNSDSMKVTYGPAVITGNFSSFYLGSLDMHSLGQNDAYEIFQNDDTTYYHQMQLGSDIRLYRADGTLLPDDSGEPASEVYIWDKDWGEGQARKLKHISYDGENFIIYGKRVIDVVCHNSKDLAGSVYDKESDGVLDRMAELSFLLSNIQDKNQTVLGGTSIGNAGDAPISTGNSTVTGPMDNGSVVSMYHMQTISSGDQYILDLAKLNDEKTTTEWYNKGLPIADNEYIVMNVVCPQKDGTFSLDATNIALRTSDGKEEASESSWRAGETASYARIIWNPVYYDSTTGTYQPFEGKVVIGDHHGGLILAPAADVETYASAQAVTVVGETVTNTKEIHQTSVGTNRTYVRMVNNPTTRVFGTKVWTNTDKAESSVTIILNAKKYGMTKAEPFAIKTFYPDENDNWNWAFEDLPKYSYDDDGNAHPIEYSITEQGVYQHNVSVSGSVENGYTITNTYTENKTTVNGTKVWDDEDDRDGIRPDSIVLTLLRRRSNGGGGNNQWEFVKTKTVTAATNWTFSFGDLNLYEERNGHKEYYKYCVAENVNDIPKDDYTPTGGTMVWWKDENNQWQSGYIFTQNTDGSGTYTVTNKHTPEKITISGTKKWNSGDITTPGEITVRLYANGVDTKQTAKANASTNWAWAFENLYKYEDGGEEIVYTVKEDATSTYENGTNYGYYTEYDVNGNVITITNTIKTVIIEWTKEWAKDSDYKNYRPGKIYLDVYRKAGVSGDTSDDELMATLELTTSWQDKVTSSELPAYNADGTKAEYYVVERDVPNYTSDTTKTGESTDNSTQKMTQSFKSVNTLEVVSVKAEKEWVGDTVSDRPGYVELYLQQSTDGTTWENVWNNSTQYKATVTATNDWSWTFENLPKYDQSGNLLKYQVVEGDVEGYNVGYSTTDEDGNFTTTITNTKKTDKVSVTVTKVWNHTGNPDDIPEEKAKVQLYRNSVAYGDTVEITAADNNTYTWEDLDAADANGNPYTYTVKEVEVPLGYLCKQTAKDSYNYTLTNTYIQGSVDFTFSATKKLDGDESEEVFTFQLYAVESLPPAPMPTDAVKENGITYVEKTTTGSVKGETVYFDKITLTSAQFADDWQKTNSDKTWPGDGNYELTYLWKLKEVIPEPPNPSVEYDSSVYEFWITVVVDENGQLKIKEGYDDDATYSTSISKDGTFTNKVDTKSISVTKVWSDGANTDISEKLKLYQEFEVGNGETQVLNVTNTEFFKEHFVFDAAKNTYTWKYLPSYVMVVTGEGESAKSEWKECTYYVQETTVDGYEAPTYANTASGMTDVKDKAYDGGTITNTKKYTATGSLQLAVKKIISGRTFQEGDEFTFKLTAKPEDGQTVPMPDAGGETVTISYGDILSATETNESPVKSFGEIKYTEKDVGQTYTYVITEVRPDTGAVADLFYDTTGHEVTVKITDDKQDGVLEVICGYNANTPVQITNTQKKVTGSFLIWKCVDIIGTPDADFKTPEGGYTFKVTVSKDGGAETEVKDDNGLPFTVAEGGRSVEVPYTFTEAGTYVFTVTEVIPDSDTTGTGMIYDDSTFTVTYVVKEDNNTLKVETETVKKGEEVVGGAIAFYNRHGSAKTRIKVVKAFNGAEGTAFQVQLKDANKNPVGEPVTIYSGVDNFIITPIYTVKDLGETFTYYISEVMPEGAVSPDYTVDGIKYDPTEYEVTVKLTYDDRETGSNGEKIENGDRLKATVYYGTDADGQDKTAVTITNEIQGSFTVKGEKKLVYEYDEAVSVPLNGRTFKFDLLKDGETNPIETITSDENGEFSFDVTLSSAEMTTLANGGTISYTIRENTDGVDERPGGYPEGDGIKYTAGPQSFKIEMENGEVKVVDTDGDNTNTFTNEYNAFGFVHLNLSKKLLGTMEEGKLYVCTVDATLYRETETGLSDVDNGSISHNFNFINGESAEGNHNPYEWETAQLNYGDEGMYYVCIREKNDKEDFPDVAFDKNVYWLRWNVTDDNKGNIIVENAQYTTACTEPDPEKALSVLKALDDDKWADLTTTTEVKGLDGIVDGPKYKYTIVNAPAVTNYVGVEASFTVKKRVEQKGDVEPDLDNTEFTLCVEDLQKAADAEQAEDAITELTMWADVSQAVGLTFTDEGTYKYLVYEKPGTEDGYVYDSHVYRVTYTVTKDAATGLSVTSTTWEVKENAEAEFAEYTLPDDGLTFVNQYGVTEGEKTSITVTKVWVDNDNEAGLRPESIKVVLSMGGGRPPVDGVKVLSEDNGWTYTWEDLDVYDANGHRFEYSVVERMPNEAYQYYVGTTTATENGFTLTNTYTTEEQLGMLMLCKSDRLNPDKKLAGAEYTLFTQESCKEEEILILPSGEKAVITTGEDGWGTLTGVPGGTYWVKETKAPTGYEVDPLAYKVVVEETAEEPAKVQVSDYPLRGALSLSKTVVAEKETEESFLFDIVLSMASGDPIVGSYEATLNGVATEAVTFTAEGENAKATVALMDGDTLVIRGLRAGVVYTVTEQANALYDVEVNGVAATGATGTITETALSVAKFQNTQKLTSFAVKKEWTGLAEGEKAPAIQLQLYCNGKAVVAATPTPDQNGWYRYTDLPAYVNGAAAVYTVKEVPVTGFTTTYINKGVTSEDAAACAYNGGTIVNSKVPQTGDSAPLGLWMLATLLAACGLLGVTVTLRKREN